jgi:hypothetical protein
MLPLLPEGTELGATGAVSVGCNAASEPPEPGPVMVAAGAYDLPDEEDEMSVSVMATAGVER